MEHTYLLILNRVEHDLLEDNEEVPRAKVFPKHFRTTKQVAKCIRETRVKSPNLDHVLFELIGEQWVQLAYIPVMDGDLMLDIKTC